MVEAEAWTGIIDDLCQHNFVLPCPELAWLHLKRPPRRQAMIMCMYGLPIKLDFLWGIWERYRVAQTILITILIFKVMRLQKDFQLK